MSKNSSVSRLELNFDQSTARDNSEAAKSRNGQFIDVTYRFSTEDIEATDWYSLVHKKELRRPIMGKNQLMMAKHRSRLDKLN